LEQKALVPPPTPAETSPEVARRLDQLEAQLQQLASAPDQTALASAAPEALDAQQQQLDALAERLAALERQLEQRTAAPSPAAAPPPAPKRTASRAATPTAAPAPAPSGGPWAVQLASVSSAEAAAGLLAKAQRAGIPAEQQVVDLDGSQVYRVRVAGFPTRQTAQDYATRAQRQLRLSKAWVTRD
jgi:cell division septation protein DedD